VRSGCGRHKILWIRVSKKLYFLTSFLYNFIFKKAGGTYENPALINRPFSMR
jgi:hypothetical protein